MSTLTAEGRIEPETLVGPDGNVPASVIENSFKLLKPTSELAGYVNLWDNMWNDEFLDAYQAMNDWGRDQIPFPGAAFVETSIVLNRENRLMSGVVPVGGRDVRPGGHHLPVPRRWSARRTTSCRWPRATGCATWSGRRTSEELWCRAGHVGLFVGRSAHKGTLPPLCDWIEAHSDAALTDRGPAASAGGPVTRGSREHMTEIVEFAADRVDAAQSFLGRIPTGESAFFKEDVSAPDVATHWLHGPADVRRYLAVDGDTVVGFTSVIPGVGWSSHVGEVRLVVDPTSRRGGVGRALARRALIAALESGLRKLVVEVVADQEPAIRLFTELGFSPEAMLCDHVRRPERELPRPDGARPRRRGRPVDDGDDRRRRRGRRLTPGGA